LTDSTLLFELILLLALTATGLALFEWLKLPAIAGFLVMGAIAGPGGFGFVSDPERVRALAELGVVFLLFEIGLELPLERLRDLGRTALVAGGIQVAVTVAIVWGAASMLGVSAPTALVLGGIVAMSSTALVMRLLSDDGQIDAPHGQLAISILVFQDLSIVPFLLAIPFLAGGTDQGAEILLLSLVRMLGALAVVLFIVRFGVPRILNRVANLRSPDLFSLLAILIVLGSAFLAEELGLTLAVGAFLAGVASATSPYANQLFAEVVPLRGVLLGVFFTAVGMLFEPSVLIDNAPLVLLYLLATTLLKTGIVVAASTLALRRSVRVGVLAGLALSQTGEFSFVLAEAATRAGLLSETLYQVVLAGSILSLLATPFIMRVAPGLADRAARLIDGPGAGEADDAAGIPETPELDTRVIVIGYGPAGQTLTRLLHAIDIPYVIIDTNARTVSQVRKRGEDIIFGDATRPTVLRRLAVDRARLIVIAISDPLATRRIVSRIRLITTDTPVLARTRFVDEVDLLDSAGASSVVAEEFEGSIELVARSLELFRIPAGAIARFTDALREEGYGAIRSPAALPMDPWLVELLDQVDTDWIEVPDDARGELSLADLGVRARTGANIVAIERAGRSTTNPRPDFALQAGDRLLVLGDAETLSGLEALLRTDWATLSSGGPHDEPR
jgi:CPA2 family monovalent cation:H+ antiporter-2